MADELIRLRIDKWLWGDRGGRSSAFASGEGATPERDARPGFVAG